jgi:hypothetical protein
MREPVGHLALHQQTDRGKIERGCDQLEQNGRRQVVRDIPGDPDIEGVTGMGQRGRSRHRFFQDLLEVDFHEVSIHDPNIPQRQEFAFVNRAEPFIEFHSHQPPCVGSDKFRQIAQTAPDFQNQGMRIGFDGGGNLLERALIDEEVLSQPFFQRQSGRAQDVREPTHAARSGGGRVRFGISAGLRDLCSKDLGFPPVLRF